MLCLPGFAETPWTGFWPPSAGDLTLSPRNIPQQTCTVAQLAALIDPASVVEVARILAIFVPGTEMSNTVEVAYTTRTSVWTNKVRNWIRLIAGGRETGRDRRQKMV
jgi:hypothetical protein